MCSQHQTHMHWFAGCRLPFFDTEISSNGSHQDINTERVRRHTGGEALRNRPPQVPKSVRPRATGPADPQPPPPRCAAPRSLRRPRRSLRSSTRTFDAIFTSEISRKLDGQTGHRKILKSCARIAKMHESIFFSNMLSKR